ncbi:MAG: TIGR03619 family F420-dependent LLM class oxidoreductase [Acidimicrobiales bacterium]
MKFGIALGRMHPSMFVEAVEAADSLGYESVWLPEHLVLPAEMAGSPFAGSEHPPVPPSTPVFDALAYLSFLAGRTSRIRLGTHVYNLALRHPFVAARAVQTLDVVSGGRAELGVGAGWLRSEWEAAGLDFASRGERLDEALGICTRLWSEERVAHSGRHFEFGEVVFEPKPVQRPHPPVLIGGESSAALARAARHDGWIGLDHSPESAASMVGLLIDLRERSGRSDAAFSVTIGASVTDEKEPQRFSEAGVDRLIVSPWARTRDVPRGLEEFARRFVA